MKKKKWIDKDTHDFSDKEPLVVHDGEVFDFVCCHCQHSNEMKIREIDDKTYWLEYRPIKLLRKTKKDTGCIHRWTGNGTIRLS